MPRSFWLVPLLGSVLCGLGGAVGGSAGTAAAPAGLLLVLVQAPGSDLAQVLGGAEQGRWRNVGDILPALQGPGRPGTYVRRAPGEGPTPVRAGLPQSFGVPCEDAYHLPVTPVNVPDRFQLFTASDLNAWPRPVTALPASSPIYREIVRAELVRRGLPNPTVRLVGLTRADLDGNGTQEVIIEATHHAGQPGDLFPPRSGQPGDYSIVLLRHVVGEQVRTVTLAADVAPRTPATENGASAVRPLAVLSRLAGVADLNGDGRMELLLYEAYYEGSAFRVWEWSPARGLTPTPLQAGCGV
ncbi:hypothetical protein [Deinococcus aerophilus]|uniref:VCBS repeat-containing protein n=1 Tax=Deinococcus aerophilus TaxID=522488 RepID=A0ABQ2GI14_9DEIO|nr:hypothetical protein [Deinococcus aerophilus]GGL97494.1 hypothetical protein GCM10010841_02340 [Deinococcus aerophilus]